MQATQILIFGASSTYGIGSTKGSWADMIKQKYLTMQYGDEGIGEQRIDVFNFAQSGLTIEEIQASVPDDIRHRHRDGWRKIALFSGGLNNSRAVNTPENFVSTPESFTEILEPTIATLAEQVDALICVGYTPIDESKTYPKRNPLNNSMSYFSNERGKLFYDLFKEVSERQGAYFVDIFDAAQALPWIPDYQVDDGLHPNDKGYQWMFEQVWPVLERVVNEN